MTEIQKSLHQKFSLYGNNAKQWMRKCVLLLPEIERERVWESKGFGDIYEYAAKLAGMGHEQVNEALRILKKIEDKPELKRVVEQKGLGAVKPIVTVATTTTAEFWAQKAMTMSKNTLETYVRELRSQAANESSAITTVSGSEQSLETNDDSKKNTQTELTTILPRKAENAVNPHQKAIEFFSSSVDTPTPPPQKITIAIQVDQEIAAQLEKLKAGSDWNDLMKQLLAIREKHLEEQQPEAVETPSPHIPIKISRHVIMRTNGTCSFPGCNKPHKILHHTARFALKKRHDPSSLEPLCKSHENLAHLSLIQNENLPTKFWRVMTNADMNSEKHKIDLLVNKYRKPNFTR